MRDYKRDTLRGLESVGIFIDGLGDLPSEGKTAQAIKDASEAVEQMFRAGGVPVSPAFEEVALSQSHGLFVVSVNFQLSPDSDHIAVTVYTRLLQYVRLQRDDTINHAITWWKMSTGMTNQETFWATCAGMMRNQIAHFVEDYNLAQQEQE